MKLEKLNGIRDKLMKEKENKNQDYIKGYTDGVLDMYLDIKGKEE